MISTYFNIVQSSTELGEVQKNFPRAPREKELHTAAKWCQLVLVTSLLVPMAVVCWFCSCRLSSTCARVQSDDLSSLKSHGSCQGWTQSVWVVCFVKLWNTWHLCYGTWCFHPLVFFSFQPHRLSSSFRSWSPASRRLDPQHSDSGGLFRQKDDGQIGANHPIVP